MTPVIGQNRAVRPARMLKRIKPLDEQIAEERTERRKDEKQPSGHGPRGIEDPLESKVDQKAESDNDESRKHADQEGLSEILSRTKRKSFPGKKELSDKSGKVNDSHRQRTSVTMPLATFFATGSPFSVCRTTRAKSSAEPGACPVMTSPSATTDAGDHSRSSSI